ncbi:hypothetical protein TorRG33x02_242110 [Trema orientale]|uniref:Uncharacterized protein n=1 Tax=Trema orientale TaxID=63057 RepID=A0A2P5DTZ3_TREOI|nr:hypothetical protein TorRG33x02_242110 [Trema orientale]
MATCFSNGKPKVQALQATINGLELRIDNFTRDIHQCFDEFMREVQTTLTRAINERDMAQNNQ